MGSLYLFYFLFFFFGLFSFLFSFDHAQSFLYFLFILFIHSFFLTASISFLCIHTLPFLFSFLFSYLLVLFYFWVVFFPSWSALESIGLSLTCLLSYFCCYLEWKEKERKEFLEASNRLSRQSFPWVAIFLSLFIPIQLLLRLSCTYPLMGFYC